MHRATQYANMQLCVGDLEVGGKPLAPSPSPAESPEIPEGKVTTAQLRDALQATVDALISAGVFKEQDQ
jgi:hypothetical protein